MKLERYYSKKRDLAFFGLTPVSKISNLYHRFLDHEGQKLFNKTLKNNKFAS